MSKEGYKGIAIFVLTGEALSDVLMLDGEGIVTQNVRYISRLVDQMADIVPGRYLSNGVNKTKKTIQFRFYKQFQSTGCSKKWRVTCDKEEFVEGSGKVKFVFSENEEDCDCVQELNVLDPDR